ncbi:MAG TPA: hypothetical protein VFU10_08475 [Gaiellaceae bacterium]|nr:hypothetical protein [Gaiellaceae bacterium]
MARFLGSVVLAAGGAVLALWGLFVALYRGDAGGNGHTYLTIAGHRTDAPPVGVAVLVLGIAAVTAGVLLIRRFR